MLDIRCARVAPETRQAIVSLVNLLDEHALLLGVAIEVARVELGVSAKRTPKPDPAADRKRAESLGTLLAEAKAMRAKNPRLSNTEIARRLAERFGGGRHYLYKLLRHVESWDNPKAYPKRFRNHGLAVTDEATVEQMASSPRRPDAHRPPTAVPDYAQRASRFGDLLAAPALPVADVASFSTCHCRPSTSCAPQGKARIRSGSGAGLYVHQTDLRAWLERMRTEEAA